MGIANDLQRRLAEQNAGKSTHAAKHLPWKIEAAIRFEKDPRAADSERYLKCGSGHAFIDHHRWSRRAANIHVES